MLQYPVAGNYLINEILASKSLFSPFSRTQDLLKKGSVENPQRSSCIHSRNGFDEWYHWREKCNLDALPIHPRPRDFILDSCHDLRDDCGLSIKHSSFVDLLFPDEILETPHSVPLQHGSSWLPAPHQHTLPHRQRTPRGQLGVWTGLVPHQPLHAGCQSRWQYCIHDSCGSGSLL